MTGVASSPPRIHTTTVGYRLVVSVDGDLASGSAASLASGLRAVLGSPERDIWIDLTDVTAVDGDATAILLAVHRELASDHRSLAVICPPGPVRAAIDRADAERRLPMFPDRASAHYYRSA